MEALTLGTLKTRGLVPSSALCLAAAGGVYLAGFPLIAAVLAAAPLVCLLGWRDERRDLIRTGQWHRPVSRDSFAIMRDDYLAVMDRSRKMTGAAGVAVAPNYQYAQFTAVIRKYLATLPAGAVDVYETYAQDWHPDCFEFGWVDDYDPQDMVFDIWPKNPRAARVQIACGSMGIAVGIGTVSRLTEQLDEQGCRLHCPASEFDHCVGFDWIAADEAFEIIKAVAEGRMVVNVTVAGNRIVQTRGKVMLIDEHARAVSGFTEPATWLGDFFMAKQACTYHYDRW